MNEFPVQHDTGILQRQLNHNNPLSAGSNMIGSPHSQDQQVWN